MHSLSGAVSGCLSECNAQSLCGGFWVDRGPPIGVTTTSTTTTSTTTTTTTTPAPGNQYFVCLLSWYGYIFSEYFVVNDMNQDCPSGQNITDESDCLSAAPEFGFCRGTTLSNQSWRRGCFLHPVSCKVYFNRDTHPDPDGKSYAICKGSGGTTTTETGQIWIFYWKTSNWYSPVSVLFPHNLKILKVVVP